MDKQINTWRLKTYLIIGFVVLFMAVSTFGFFLVKNFNYIDGRTTQMNEIVQTLADLQELRGDTKAAEANVKDALLRDTEAYLNYYYIAAGRYENFLDTLQDRLVPNPVTSIEFDDLRAIVERRFERLEEIMHIYREEGGSDGGIRQLRGRTIGVEINNHIDSAFANVIDKEETYLKSQEVRFRESEKRAAIILASLLLFICASFAFTGHIIRIVILQETRQKLLADHNATLESEVEKRTAELQETNKELESFSYSVSHDLRAPLRAIEGFSNILLEDYPDKLGADGLQQVDVIVTNVRQMGQLIDDILNFSRLGRKDIQKINFDLTKIAAGALEEVKKSVYFQTEDSIHLNDLGFAHVDSSMMRQVFTNLIGNAVKFASKNPAPEISIGTVTGSPKTYYVRDNGVGFDMKHVNKLFNVFHRLHRSDEFEGTGVGLAIVKKIINKHGGQIWVESSPNAGATFYFSLP